MFCVSHDIGNFTSLAKNYSITGTIPASLCYANYLVVLDLSGNCGLKTMDLRRNNLEGKIPASLTNRTSLEVMNLSNRFHGAITRAEASQSWSNLQITDIASNNFSEYLTSNWSSCWRRVMRESDVLDHISFNYLEQSSLYYQDTVTVTIKGLEFELVKILTIFTSIDCSDNYFEGEIPQYLGQLSSLHVLNLSHNSFVGTIPKSLIVSVSSLESLDLTRNRDDTRGASKSRIPLFPESILQ
ncbi:receptor-like protein 18 [Primulina eburnea]|uniref:receptor-like protein 18 n=1 Tax=Primulina eburnea TaxID=1245227 RepID=UPI003C6C1FAF